MFYKNDNINISIFQLRETLQFTNTIQPIGLPIENPELPDDGISAVVTGWGVTAVSDSSGAKSKFNLSGFF